MPIETKEISEMIPVEIEELIPQLQSKSEFNEYDINSACDLAKLGYLNVSVATIIAKKLPV